MNLRVTRLIFLGAVILMALAAGRADAENPPEAAAAQKAGESAAAPGVSEMDIAFQLVHYGIGVNDPLPLIAAAKMIKRIPAENRTKPAAGDLPAGDGKYDFATPEGILSKAKDLAGSKPELLAMIDSVAAYTPVKTRGRYVTYYVPTRHCYYR